MDTRDTIHPHPNTFVNSWRTIRPVDWYCGSNDHCGLVFQRDLAMIILYLTMIYYDILRDTITSLNTCHDNLLLYFNMIACYDALQWYLSPRHLTMIPYSILPYHGNWPRYILWYLPMIVYCDTLLWYLIMIPYHNTSLWYFMPVR